MSVEKVAFQTTIVLQNFAEEFVQLMQNFSLILGPHVSQHELARLRLGLEELVRNAYEHGSLGISGQEKAQALEEEIWEQLHLERSKLAQNAKKKILISLEITNQILCCMVRDEGNGFDWRKLQNAPVDSSEALHGRGLYLVNHAYDRVTFNGLGNEVSVEKVLTQTANHD